MNSHNQPYRNTHAQLKRTTLSLAVASLLFGMAQSGIADTVDLGTVSGSAQTQAPAQMFGTPTPTNVESTPAEQIQNVQTFDQDASQGVTTITAGRMATLPPGASFTQALAVLPNVVVLTGSDSMTGDNVYVNGLPKTLINFTVDDIPLNDSDNYAFYSNEFIPTNLVGSIQYYPGAGSAAIPGLAAFAGSVQTYSMDPGPDMYIEPMFGVGSYGKHNAGVLLNTGILGGNTGAPTTIYWMHNHIAMDGYFNNTPAQQTTDNIKSVTAFGRAKLTLYYARNDETFNYYDGCTAAGIAAQGDQCNLLGSNMYNSNGSVNTYYAGWNFNKYLDSMAYGKLVLPLANGAEISDQPYFYHGDGFGEGDTTRSMHLLTPGGTYALVSPSANGVLINPSYNVTRRYGNILKLLLPFGDVTTEAGLWYNHNASMHDGRYINSSTGLYVGSLYQEQVNTDTTEPYINFTWKATPALTFDVGGKNLSMNRTFFDAVAQAAGKTSQFDSNYSGFLPSFSVNYKVASNASVYANYTKNVNPPAYNQFYTGTYNPNLAAEEADTYDIGGTWKSGIWSSSIDAFQLNFNNYIVSSTITSGTSTISELANAGAATNKGISWQNNFMFTPNWSMYANIGWLDAYFDTFNQNFPYAPNNTETLGVIYHTEAFNASLSGQHVGSSYFSVGNYPTNTLLQLPSYTVVNASASYTFKYAGMSSQLGFKDATVAVNVTNLFNTMYVDSYYNASTQEMSLPREFYLSVNARF